MIYTHFETLLFCLILFIQFINSMDIDAIFGNTENTYIMQLISREPTLLQELNFVIPKYLHI